MENIDNEAKMILKTIADAKKYSNPFNSTELFFICEDLIGKLAYFVGPLMDAEKMYRDKVVMFKQGGESASAADQMAKASPEYILWKKLDAVYDLGKEQIMLIKKFADKLDFERRNVEPTLKG